MIQATWITRVEQVLAKDMVLPSIWENVHRRAATITKVLRIYEDGLILLHTDLLIDHDDDGDRPRGKHHGYSYDVAKESEIMHLIGHLPMAHPDELVEWDETDGLPDTDALPTHIYNNGNIMAVLEEYGLV